VAAPAQAATADDEVRKARKQRVVDPGRGWSHRTDKLLTGGTVLRAYPAAPPAPHDARHSFAAGTTAPANVPAPRIC